MKKKLNTLDKVMIVWLGIIFISSVPIIKYFSERSNIWVENHYIKVEDSLDFHLNDFRNEHGVFILNENYAFFYGKGYYSEDKDKGSVFKVSISGYIFEDLKKNKQIQVVKQKNSREILFQVNDGSYYKFIMEDKNKIKE